MLHMLLDYAGHVLNLEVENPNIVTSGILNLINFLHCRSLSRIPPFAWTAILYLWKTWMVRIYSCILISGSCFWRFPSIVFLRSFVYLKILYLTPFLSACLPLFFFFKWTNSSEWLRIFYAYRHGCEIAWTYHIM